MFKPNEIEAMPVVLEGYFKDLENRIMEDIVRRIRINSEITSTADLQMQRLSEMGASKKAIKDYIQQALQLSEQGIDDLYSGAIRKGYNADRDLYTATGRDFIPYAENQQLQQLVEAVKKQTNSDIKNITQSMGFAVRQPDGRLTFQPIADYYQKTLDKAVLDITSGSFDYNTVLKRTVQEMTDSGLRWIDYASGHHNRVPVAVRRAVMTGVNQVTAKIAEQNMELLQTEYVEVSWHRGARPSHQVWQGKIYHWKEKAVSRQTETTPPTSPENSPANQENNLTFTENISTIEESRKNRTVKPITDVSIDKVKPVDSVAYSNEENQIICQKHKELLLYARKNNPGAECAFILSSDFSKQVESIGKESTLDFSSCEAIDMLTYQRNLYVMHNHPKNSSFSLNDIKFLIENNSVKTISIAKHNGRIEQLTKSPYYSFDEARKSLMNITRKYYINGSDKEYDKIIREFIQLKELFIYAKT